MKANRRPSASRAASLLSTFAIAAGLIASTGCVGGSMRQTFAARLEGAPPIVSLAENLFAPTAQRPRHPRHRPPVAPPPPYRDDDRYRDDWERDDRDRDRDRDHGRRPGGTLLGVNEGNGDQPHRDGGAFVAYWCMNRFLDFFDIFTITVGGGPALHAEVHVTEMFRFGLGGGLQATFGLSEAPGQGGFYKRSFFEAAVGPVQIGSIDHESIVSSVVRIDEKYEGVMFPEDYLYQVKRDYWSIGGSAAFFFGAQAEVHLLQLFDWLAGFALLDPLRDDI